MRYPSTLLKARKWSSTRNPSVDIDEYIGSNTQNSVNKAIKSTVTTNSTLMFLSRLVNLLNQYPRRFKRSSVINYPRNNQASIFNSFTVAKSYPYSLTMTRPSQTKLSQTIRKRKKSRNHINFIFRKNSASSLYHVIDSCGLFSVDGIQGAYLCRNTINEVSNNKRNNTQTNHYTNSPVKYTPAIDHLIPQCNPTCGYLSNPQRMKLVDVLALYEVNTDLLASLLGLSASKLRSYDSEQQMRALFCGNNRVRRDLSQLILPQLSV